ncbi:MAG: sugar phosphate isomerase/epimerase [Albidovulum sp.]|nr:sugar phosphate isomerase/epimerase [Albidovulum sp.]MDE0530607.1 sugar phosphate isomerase/epimerase [Albidovulum sp.]
MKLAFNTWVYSSFPVWVPAYPLEEVIRRLAHIGYDGIEIGAAAPHAYPDYLTPTRRTEIRSILDDAGLALASMLPAPGGGAGFNAASANPLERAAAVDQYRKVADLCAEWGGKTLLYVAGWQVFGTSRRDAWKWSVDSLVDVAEHADELGLNVAVEPTSADSNLVDSCDDVMTMMAEVGRANVKAMFDTYHTLYRNEVATDYVYRLKEDLAHIHLADIDRNPPGSGVVDYVSLIESLRDIEFDGYLTMEIGFSRRNVEPDDMARRAYDYMKSIL